MARKSNDSGGGARAWILITVALVSCFLVYTCLTLRSSSGDTRTAVAESRIGLSAGVAGGEEEGECCRGVENMELWGSAVKWGTDHKFNSSRDCCMACKAMCQVADGPCLCDSWVFCGDRERCGAKFGECWLKKQKDALLPDLQESGKKVIWTSGLIFGKGEGVVGLETDYGTLHIKLFPECAPHSVAYIVELLRARHCAGCHLYRAEGRGHSWDYEGNPIADTPNKQRELERKSNRISDHSMENMTEEQTGSPSVSSAKPFENRDRTVGGWAGAISILQGFPPHLTSEAPLGPPYALIQGKLEAHGIPYKNIPTEACPAIRRGSVAWVGSGPEFFISLANHDEWRGAYTVFGSVLPEDMEVAEKIASLPTKSDVWNGITVSVLVNPIQLKLRRATGSNEALNLGGNGDSNSGAS